MSNDSQHAKRRGLRLVLAVSTSLVSKLGTIVLQIVAIPVAMHALGFEVFGVYAALTTAVYFLSMAGIGVGPGLTRVIAQAQAAGDRELERSYIVNASVILIVAGSLAAAVVYGVLTYAPVTTLFGKEFAPYQDIVRSCAPLVAGMVFMEIFLSMIDRVHGGYQEMHRVNLWGAVGNFLGGVLLLCFIKQWPSIPFLMICVLGMQQLCRLCNGLVTVLFRRRYLMQGPLTFSKARMGELIRDGLAFTGAQNIGPLLHREGAKLVASHFFGPTGAAVIAVLNQLSTMLSGFISMFAAPLWPALIDAAYRNDFAWFDAARKRLWAGVLAYAGAIIIILVGFGPYLIDLWLGGEVPIARPKLTAFAFYYAASAWNYINYVCLTGLGVIVMPALIFVLEAAAALFCGWVAIQFFEIPGLIWGMTAVMACCSAWIFPTMLMNHLKRCKADSNLAATPTMQ